MKLNLDKQLLGLKGEPLQGDKMSDVLANNLAMSTVGKPAKMMAWAVNLINEGEIQVDKSDIKFLIEFVNDSKGMVNLAKAQLIDEIEKLKE
jgi:hypothetical protein